MHGFFFCDKISSQLGNLEHRVEEVKGTARPSGGIRVNQQLGSGKGDLHMGILLQLQVQGPSQSMPLPSPGILS